MKLLEAKVTSARQVTTKHGQKTVLNVVTDTGDEIAIWKPAGDVEILARKSGERVNIAIDDKGKAALLECSPTSPQPLTQAQPMGFAVEPVAPASRSAEITDYIQRLAKLYGHCLTTAANLPTTVELNPPQVKDIATTLFIHATKHFDL
jgi:Na+-transporting NADH:ubiquinone oxidoreductase subunit NqrA